MNRAPSSTPANCPDPAELAVFFEGKLTDVQRPDIVAHVANCLECRNALGALGRMSASELPEVPSELRTIAAGHLSFRRWRSAAAVLAAAACVLFAVSIARQSPEQAGNSASTPGVAVPSDSPDDVRARTAGGAPQLMEPKGGATLSSSTRFEWTPVAGAVQYQLHVLTADGEVVFDATTAATSIEFGGAEDRQGPFYAWVAAQLTDGRRVQSAVVRLAGPAR